LDTSKVPYPFDEVGPRDALTPEDLAALEQPGVVGRSHNPHRAEARRAHAGELFMPVRSRVPKWVDAHFKRGGDLGGLVEAVRAQALRAPTRSTLMLALNVLREVGRTKSGGKLIAKHANQSVLDELFSRKAQRAKKR
jgi:hypothetical protein